MLRACQGVREATTIAHHNQREKVSKWLQNTCFPAYTLWLWNYIPHPHPYLPRKGGFLTKNIYKTKKGQRCTAQSLYTGIPTMLSG